jgi:N-acetylneuraminate synthase
MKINGKEIGRHSPTYFIAEIGSNYDGDLERAKDLIKIAADSDADAVKFQHYTADSLVSDKGFEKLSPEVETHQTKWKDSVSKIYDKAALNKDWTETLYETAHDLGMGFLTSPYSLELIDYVEPYIDSYKIGSGDITYNSVIAKISEKNKPILIATGASTMTDIKNAMDIILEKNKPSEICLMQCNTNYEGSISHAKYQNLNVLTTLKGVYPEIVLGLSCHMPGWTSVLGSVALGAKIIEKHFTDDRSRQGPDHGFAINPAEWKSMVNETRVLESMLGDGIKKVEDNEKKTIIVQQRCLRSKLDLNPGDIVIESMIESLRPCPNGAIKPSDIELVLNKTITKPLKNGEHFTADHFS